MSLLLEVRLNDLILAEAMPGYINDGSIMLPLRDLAAALDFPIAVDSRAGRASGWFLRENNLFSLDVATGEAIFAGKVQPFGPGLTEIHDTDIYVDARLLASWFPIDITYDLAEQLVFLKSREPLPVEQRLAREQKRDRLLRGERSKRDLPQVAFPRETGIGPPMGDFSFQSGMDVSPDGNADSSQRFGAVLTNEMFGFNGHLALAGDNRDKISDARLRLERKDTNGDVFGETLDVTEFMMGDVVSPQQTLTARTAIGRGAYISSVPLNQPREFDRITLTGELPLGWDVELYRNEVLIEFASSRPDGRYQFIDVPLLFGVNVLKLVFYGPQGQRREEIRQLRVGEDQIRPGEVNYTFSANQHERNLLVQNTSAFEDKREGGNRVVGEVQAGLTQNISMAANLTSLPMADGTRADYTGVSGRFAVEDLFSRIDFVNQVGGGWATRASAQQSVFGISVIGEHDIYNGFYSEQVARVADPLTSTSTLRLDGRIPVPVINQIPINLTGGFDQRESGETEQRVSSRLSAAVGRLSVTGTSTLRRRETADGNAQISSDGNLLVGGRVDRIRLRGSAGYTTRPVVELTNTSMTGEYDVTPAVRARVGLSHDLAGGGISAVSLGGSYLGKVASYGASLDYNTRDEAALIFTASFSAAPAARAGSYAMQPTELAEKGALAVKVFRDDNANGIRDEGEEMLPDIGVRVDGVPRRTLTDASGSLLLTGLEPYLDTDVDLDRATLGDPYLVGLPEGIRFVPRPGGIPTFEFAVVSTGEIDGVVYRMWPDHSGPVSGARVQLLDAKGEVIREARSAYDGFFLFEFVIPAHYTLRIDPEQLEELNLTVDGERPITIEGDGTVVSGQEMFLRPRDGGASPAAKPSEGAGAKPAPGEPVPVPVPVPGEPAVTEPAIEPIPRIPVIREPAAQEREASSGAIMHAGIRPPAMLAADQPLLVQASLTTIPQAPAFNAAASGRKDTGKKPEAQDGGTGAKSAKSKVKADAKTKAVTKVSGAKTTGVAVKAQGVAKASKGAATATKAIGKTKSVTRAKNATQTNAPSSEKRKVVKGKGVAKASGLTKPGGGAAKAKVIGKRERGVEASGSNGGSGQVAEQPSLRLLIGAPAEASSPPKAQAGAGAVRSADHSGRASSDADLAAIQKQMGPGMTQALCKSAPRGVTLGFCDPL